MAHKLADELLTIILSPQLVVSDELFAHTGSVSPFTKVEKSASDVLLVCKRWMRFATPALYQTVILRSTAQAQALALALTENSKLGAFIKKLRVEGAYGRYILDIVQRAPNITDFCFTLTVWSTCSVTGLVRSLDLLNPTRVVLTLAHKSEIRNSKRTEVVEALCAVIPTWTRLRSFHFPASGFFDNYSIAQILEFEQYPELLGALSLSASLKSLYIWHRAWIPMTAEPLNVFATNASAIETIWLLQGHPISEPEDVFVCRVFGPDSPLRRRVRVLVSDTMRLNPGALRRWQQASVALNSNPFYQPMHGAPEATKCAIWAKIIGFVLRINRVALSINHVQDSRSPWFDPAYWEAWITNSLLSVSRSFSATVRRVLFKHIAVNNDRAVRTIQKYLQQDPSLARETETAMITCRDPLPILSQLTNLRSCVVRICPTILAALPSDTLVELTLLNEWNQKPPLTPSILAPFTGLKKLNWGCRFGHPIDVPEDDADKLEILANLEQLDIGYAPEEFMDMLALFRLPKLFEVKMEMFYSDGTKFFDAHGAKLQRLSIGKIDADVLRACTSLEVLELYQQAEKKRGRRAVSPLEIGHGTLRQIKVHWWLATDRNGVGTRVWQDFFDSFARARYPALRDIHLKHPRAERLWPNTEREIRASPWPAIAEKLAAEGIAIRDPEGRAWRARLKLQ